MANIGDKYIIEIREPIGLGNGYYWVKNSMHDDISVSDEALQGFEKYDPEADYRRGLNAAWEAARKIAGAPSHGGLDPRELIKLFGTSLATKVMYMVTVDQAIEKLRTYEVQEKAEEEIKVGDEIKVRVYSPERTINIIVYDVSRCGSTNVYGALSLEEGKCFKISENRKVKKTGRHFPQVAELLDAMKEDGEA